MSNSNKLAWFAAGAALGATVALLYAPQSGEETRYYIRKTARRGRRRVTEASREAMEQGRDILSRGREFASALKDEAATLRSR
jgi:gas vesicle protein